MTIRFPRRKIETACIALSFGLTAVLSVFIILLMADKILDWDIFSRMVERVLGMIIACVGVVLGACFLIVLMVNMRISSISMERMAGAMEDRNADRNGR
ncbi:MAG: hypothetical protein IPH05_15885 [Flavobacteriales bacterium]|nr:hypothetical protein [Flavobacteriales bacterium]